MPQLQPLDRCCPTQPPALDRCWLVPKSPPCFIQLGRFGDLILLFPAFKLIYDRTGQRPIVIVSNDYASVFDGISYAQPYPIKAHWFLEMPKARDIAARLFGGGIVPQWWNETNPKGVPPGPQVLQCHGEKWGVDINKYPDFGTSMWIRAGFTREEMMTAPLVFDRRSPEREESLAKLYVQPNRKLLLYNFTGISSPFGYVPEMMRVLSDYQTRFRMINIGAIKASRIYDLLGLYDLAVGLITIDTATGHLAPASKVPTIWFTVPGWTRSVPRGNVALHMPYNHFPKRASEIRPVLERWANET